MRTRHVEQDHGVVMIRKNILIIATQAILGLCSLSGAFGLDSSQLSSLQRLSMQSFANQEIQDDLPVTDIILDTDNGLWIAGQTSIWRWSLLTDHIQKIHLIKKSGESLKALGAQKSALLAASDKSIFRITFDPPRVVRFQHPSYKNGKTLGIQLAKDGLRWLHEDGIMRVSATEAKLLTPPLSSKIDVHTGVLDKHDANAIWLSDKNMLIRSRLDNKKIRSHLIHKSKRPFIAIKTSPTDVLAATSKAVLRFNIEGKLIQAIPVGQKRKLVAMHTTDSLHYYLFDDGLLERLDLKKETKHYFQLPSQDAEKTKKIIGKNSVIALLDDGIPTAYLLRELSILK